MDKDADGITLTMDDPSGSTNVMNEAYIESMAMSTPCRRKAIRSPMVMPRRKTFAGGDVKTMIQARPRGRRRCIQHRRDHRGSCALETLQAGRGHQRRRWAVPGDRAGVSSRIADVKGSQLGLPETLGLLPGGGGVTHGTPFGHPERS